MLNNVILMGRLVEDPELKKTSSGKSVCSTRIAVERSYAKQGEERKADFFSIVMWGNTAEFCTRYFGKGSLIAVQGQLQSSTYQSKDGSNRYKVEVLVERLSFTGERTDNTQQNGNVQQNGYQNQYNNGYNQQNGGYNQQNYYPQQPNYAVDNTDFADIPLDDDLPF